MLSVVFVYLVMPCVVLNAFQIKDTPEIRTGLLYSMGIAVGMHVVFLLLNALFRKALKLDAVEQVNIIYSNAAALVIPIVQALLGVGICCLLLRLCHCTAGTALDPCKCLPAGVCPAGMAQAPYQCQSDRHCSRCAAVPAARLAARPDHQHTEQCRQYDRPHGNAAGRHGHCGSALQKDFRTPRNYLPVFLRLLGVPLVIVLLLWAVHASLWIPDGKSILMTVYLSAITPACATVTSMAQLYDRDASHSSAIYVLSTLLSILTMPLMIGSFELLL